jgi:galactokinase
VNLIGEHTDYNEGFVLPVAIDRTVAVAAAARDDRRVTVRSLDFDQRDAFPLDGIERSADWRNYMRGVAWALEDAGHSLRGTDLIVSGDVPQGAGLSSSAAIEVAVAGALCAVARNDLGTRDLALIAQGGERLRRRAVRNHGPVRVTLSQAGQALLIDCHSLNVEQIPLPFDEAGIALVIVDSKVPRRLEAAPYNERRRECEDAAAALGLSSLRDVGSAMLEARHADLSQRLYKRARHVAPRAEFSERSSTQGRDAMRRN